MVARGGRRGRGGARETTAGHRETLKGHGNLRDPDCGGDLGEV